MSNNKNICCASCGIEGVELVQTTECNDGTPWLECSDCRACDEHGKRVRAIEVAIAYFRALVPMTADGIEYRIATGVDPVREVASLEAKLSALLADRAA